MAYYPSGESVKVINFWESDSESQRDSTYTIDMMMSWFVSKSCLAQKQLLGLMDDPLATDVIPTMKFEKWKCTGSIETKTQSVRAGHRVSYEDDELICYRGF